MIYIQGIITPHGSIGISQRATAIDILADGAAGDVDINATQGDASLATAKDRAIDFATRNGDIGIKYA